MKRINHLIQKLACSASKAAPLAIVVAGLFATSPIALAQQCSFTGFPTVYANPGQNFSSAGTLSISGIYGPTLFNVGYIQSGPIQSLDVGSAGQQWPPQGQEFLSSSQGVTVSGWVPLNAPPVAQVTFNVSSPGGMYCDDWVTVVVQPPPPPPLVCSGNAALIQSNYQAPGNFEVVFPNNPGQTPSDGMAHYYRDNIDGGVWHFDTNFETAAVGAVSMIESSYGNLEVVARIGSQLQHFYRSGATWIPGPIFASGASGTPSLIQDPSAGNFEVVTPLATGGMAHYYRVNNIWYGPTAKFGGSGTILSAALIYSSYGNLEVVSRGADCSVDHYYRTFANNQWNGPAIIVQ